VIWSISVDNGEAVWQCKDGDLTHVRSYAGGAVRVIIFLKGDGQNLTCTAGQAVGARSAPFSKQPTSSLWPDWPSE